MLFQSSFASDSEGFAPLNFEAGADMRFMATSIFTADGIAAQGEPASGELRENATAWQGTANRARHAERFFELMTIGAAAKGNVQVGVFTAIADFFIGLLGDHAEQKAKELNAKADKAEAKAKNSGRTPNSSRTDKSRSSGDFSRGGFTGNTHGGRASELGAGERARGWA